MTDWPKVPPEPSPSPSGMPSQVAAVMALVTALGGVVATWRGYEGGQDTQRAMYEALKLRSEFQGRQLEELVRKQAEHAEWMAELGQKLDERTRTTESVLRKVAKRKVAAPLPVEPPPPAPPPPPMVDVRPAAPLPSFEQLSK